MNTALPEAFIVRMRAQLGPDADAFFAALESGDPACSARLRVFLDALALLCCTIDMLYACEIRLSGVLSEFTRTWRVLRCKEVRMCLSILLSDAENITS